MKRPNFISKDNSAKKTRKAGLKYVHEKQPKRFHYPEKSKKLSVVEHKTTVFPF